MDYRDRTGRIYLVRHKFCRYFYPGKSHLEVSKTMRKNLAHLSIALMLSLFCKADVLNFPEGIAIPPFMNLMSGGPSALNAASSTVDASGLFSLKGGLFVPLFWGLSQLLRAIRILLQVLRHSMPKMNRQGLLIA